MPGENNENNAAIEMETPVNLQAEPRLSLFQGYLNASDDFSPCYRITPGLIGRVSVATLIGYLGNLFCKEAVEQLFRDVLGVQSSALIHTGTVLNITGQALVNGYIVYEVLDKMAKEGSFYLPALLNQALTRIRARSGYTQLDQDETQKASLKDILLFLTKYSSSLSVAVCFVLLAYYEFPEEQSNAAKWMLAFPVAGTEGTEAVLGFEGITALNEHFRFTGGNLLRRNKAKLWQGDTPKNQLCTVGNTHEEVELHTLSVQEETILLLHYLQTTLEKISYLDEAGRRQYAALFNHLLRSAPVIETFPLSTQVLIFNDVLRLNALPSAIFDATPDAANLLTTLSKRYQDILTKHSTYANSKTETKMIRPYRRNYTAQSWAFVFLLLPFSVFMLAYYADFVRNFVKVLGNPVSDEQSWYEWPWKENHSLISASLITFPAFFLLTMLCFAAMGRIVRPNEYSTRSIVEQMLPKTATFLHFSAFFFSSTASALPFSLGRELADSRDLATLSELDPLAKLGYLLGGVAYFASSLFLWFYSDVILQGILSFFLQRQAILSNTPFGLTAEDSQYMRIVTKITNIAALLPELAVQDDIMHHKLGLDSTAEYPHPVYTGSDVIGTYLNGTMKSGTTHAPLVEYLYGRTREKLRVDCDKTFPPSTTPGEDLDAANADMSPQATPLRNIV